MSLFVAAALVITTYMPWKTLKPYIESCTEPASAIIVETGRQEKDGSFYYGPKVEYAVASNGKTLRSDAVNTVNLNTKWEENTAIAVYYNPTDPSQVILRNDNTARNHFYAARFAAVVIVAAAFAFFVAAAVCKGLRSRPKKYRSNIAGQNFEDWQRSVLAQQEEGIPDVDLNVKEDLGKPNENQTRYMDDAQ
jgi:hypothetical protein